MVDLEDDDDDVKHEEAPLPPPAAAGTVHGAPQLLTTKVIEAQMVEDVSAKLSAMPFLRELISPHGMGDDALLSRTAALGLIARAHFGRDASFEVQAATARARGCNPACAQAATLYICVCVCVCHTYKVLARRMKRMEQAAAERGTRLCTGLPMPAPPRPAVAAATHCHESMPPPHHAAPRLAPPPHHTANNPRPPPVPPPEREPTLHIPDDVLRHLRRGDSTLLGAPPPLQPHVLEAATMRWRLMW